MEFTDSEKKMIKLLRLQHSGWRSTRWIIVIFTTFFALFCFFIDGAVENCALPAIILGFVAGAYSYVIGGWHGRPEISLLLKLVEEKIGSEKIELNQDNAV